MKLPTRTKDGIRYYQAGANSPLVVFIHGLGTSLDFWTAVAPQVAEFVEVLAFDLPGSGRSPFHGTQYDLKTVAIQAAEFIEANTSGDRFIVGHSLGALIVLQMVALKPELADKILLVDPVLFSVEGVLTSPAAALRDPRLLLTTLAQFVGVLIPRQVSEIILRNPLARVLTLSSYVYAPRDLNPELIDQALSGDTFQASARLPGVLRAAKNVHLASLVTQVKADVYIIHGDEDPLCPPADITRLSESVKLLQVFGIEHCGHLPMLERPDELAKLLTQIAKPSRSRV